MTQFLHQGHQTVQMRNLLILIRLHFFQNQIQEIKLNLQKVHSTKGEKFDIILIDIINPV